MLKINVLIAALILLCPFWALAQNQEVEEDFRSRFEAGLKGGISIGTPIGPAPEGTSSASGAPGVGPMFGALIRYNINRRWAIQGEGLYVYKNSTFKSTVVDKYHKVTQAIVLPDTTVYAEVETIFSGDISGSFNNRYLEFPISAFYTLSDRWELSLGAYFSKLTKGGSTGEATGNAGILLLEREPFDESYAIVRFDYGASLGASYEILKGLDVGLRLTTGLNSIYSEDYPAYSSEDVLRNVYLNCTLDYRFGFAGSVH